MSEARSKLMHFLNTAPEAGAGSEVWSRFGDGVTDMSIDYNPQTTTEQYIINDSASTHLTGYQPSASPTMRVVKDDPVFTYVNKLRTERAVLDEAKTELITVESYLPIQTDSYPAEKQEVSVAVVRFGGPAADPLSIDIQLNWKGDPIKGLFNPTTKTFTAS